MNDDPVFAMRAIEIGARGFVAKTGDPNNLVGDPRTEQRRSLSAADDVLGKSDGQ
jgi:DNA-binding NarL/FixJ family response regulator